MKTDEQVLSEIATDEITFIVGEETRTFTREGFERFVNVHLRFDGVVLGRHNIAREVQKVRKILMWRTGSHESAAACLDKLFHWRTIMTLRGIDDLKAFNAGYG